jgi:hypothetical protein
MVARADVRSALSSGSTVANRNRAFSARNALLLRSQQRTLIVTTGRAPLDVGDCAKRLTICKSSLPALPRCYVYEERRSGALSDLISD